MSGLGRYVLLGVLLPGLAWGADVRLSVAGSVEYDDNVTRSEDDKQDDAVFRVSPQIRLVEDREKFNYSVGYMLPYEIGVTSDAVNDLNQLADANFRYRLSPQTEVFGTDNFFYVRGLFSQDQNLEDPTLGDVGDERDRVLQNNVSLGARHQFTPRLSGTVIVNNGVYDTNQFARANVLSYGGSASSEYQLTPHHALGGGFSFSRQSFDDTFNRPSSDTEYYNLFGSWEWLFDETTAFNIQAGPALIHSTQETPPAVIANQQQIPFAPVGLQLGFPNDNDAIVVGNFASCPIEDIKDAMGVPIPTELLFNNAGESCGQVLLVPTTPASAAAITTITSLPLADIAYLPGEEPDAIDDTRVTYFASARLTKRWTPKLASSLAYTRQENGAAGIDGGAVLDAITLSNSWRISERWDASVRTDWTLRKSATDAGRVFVIASAQDLGLPFDVAGAQNAVQVDSSDSLNTQRWGMAGRLAYRLTKNTVTALQYAYNKQSSDGDTVGQDSDFDNHLVTFTVQYNFEPIGLPW